MSLRKGNMQRMMLMSGLGAVTGGETENNNNSSMKKLNSTASHDLLLGRVSGGKETRIG